MKSLAKRLRLDFQDKSVAGGEVFCLLPTNLSKLLPFPHPAQRGFRCLRWNLGHDGACPSGAVLSKLARRDMVRHVPNLCGSPESSCGPMGVKASVWFFRMNHDVQFGISDTMSAFSPFMQIRGHSSSSFDHLPKVIPVSTPRAASVPVLNA